MEQNECHRKSTETAHDASFQRWTSTASPQVAAGTAAGVPPDHQEPPVTWLCAVKGAPDKQMPHSRKSENKQAKDSTEGTRFCWAHFKATQENVSNFSKYLCSTLLQRPNIFLIYLTKTSDQRTNTYWNLEVLVGIMTYHKNQHYIQLLKNPTKTQASCCCSVAQSCLTLCNPMDYSRPDSSSSIISTQVMLMEIYWPRKVKVPLKLSQHTTFEASGLVWLNSVIYTVISASQNFQRKVAKRTRQHII